MYLLQYAYTIHVVCLNKVNRLFNLIIHLFSHNSIHTIIRTILTVNTIIRIKSKERV